MIVQAWILLTGLTALCLLQFGGEHARKVAPFVGLAGQPAWLFAAISTRQFGMLGVVAAYTLVWAVGCVKVWRAR